MRKIAIFPICFIFILACKGKAVDSKEVFAKSQALKVSELQKPVVAGAFYPGSRETLQKTIGDFLSKADSQPVSGDLMGVIVPHAGYQYSGPVAAYGFKQLEGRKYDYVVVIAPSHHKSINGAATRLAKFFETPLGKIPVATDIVKKMVKKYKWIINDPDAYGKEHALEVELPFLQTVLKGFKLIPLVVGTHHADILENIAGSLNEEFIGKNVLYVISTDLSHYHSYSEAVKMDKKTLELLTSEKFDELVMDVYDGKCELCGFGPVMVILNLYRMRGGGKIELLKYANSGDVTGDKSRVVGYGALAVVGKFELSDKEKQELLKISRETLVAHVEGKKVGVPKVSDPYLMKPGAPFVTLKKHGELRGCIGHIIAREPLAKAVSDNTIAAASHDPRFPPVTKGELKDISIEISVLTPPQPVYDPNTIKVGRDGIIIEKGMRRGVLLPQVPGEAGWDLPQYLAGICRKAGLSPSDINDPATKLGRYQAIVFH